MKHKVFLVYLSPAGSTRHVARVMETTLSACPVDLQVLDLGGRQDQKSILATIQTMGKNDCIFLGSPVYRDMALPPVMAFIQSLPQVTLSYAIPFVTWGGACSGIALWQMGTALVEKGFQLAGAAKVLGLHSMMWRSSAPPGQGHPDAIDDQAVERLVRHVIDRLGQGSIQPLAPAALDYSQEDQREGMKAKLTQPWMVIPKTVDETACTQCGQCEPACPVGAVSLSPFPVLAEHCFDCFNCVRVCPENAIVPGVPSEKIESYIRSRVSTFNEDRTPRIWGLN